MRSLEFEILGDADDSIDQYFEEVTRKCTKLKIFCLDLENISLISEHFLKVLSHLKVVEKLELMLRDSMELKPGVKYLKDCTKLQTFTIINAELTEDFFDGIQTFVPNIRTIKIIGNYRLQFSDQFFKTLSSMKYLQKVQFEWYYEPIEKMQIFYYNKSLKINENNNRIKLSQNKPNV